MGRKERLQKRILKREAKKKELNARAIASNDAAEVRAINQEIDEINQEVDELREEIEEIDAEERDAQERSTQTNEAAQRAGSPISGAQIMGTYVMGNATDNQQQRAKEPEDVYGTVAYRMAFMEFAKTGRVTPELRAVAEQRADAMTTTTDVSAVIPSTILKEVIHKITVYGQVFNRVRKLNVKGGVSIPILSLKPVATWIGEATPSDKQKVTANTNLIFSYYGLECKVSVSLLADTVTLEGFETTITDLIVEAMVKAMDLAIIKGTGTGTPLGITIDNRVPAGQVVTLTPADFALWSAWKKKVFAKMPLAYKAGATFLMASGTFEGYIDGMTDSTGQPIGRVNYGIADGPQGRFGGKEVIEVEDDVIANYDDAAVGDVVAVYCNLKNYGFNSNMQLTMFRYFDHDTNEWVDKAILIADGKLIDPNGVVIVKKGA